MSRQVHELDFYTTVLRLDRATTVLVTLLLVFILFALTQLWAITFSGWLDMVLQWNSQGPVYVSGLTVMVFAIALRFASAGRRLWKMKEDRAVRRPAPAAPAAAHGMELPMLAARYRSRQPQAV